jgi:hypothetical protein
MANNIHPTKGASPFQFEVRPNIFNPTEMSEIIERHGQWVRWRKAKPCPNRTEAGQHPMICNVCHGRGEIYEFQRHQMVYGERSPHGVKSVFAGEEDLVRTWKSPISRVERVVRYIHEKQGGSKIIPIISHTTEVIRIGEIPGETGYPLSHEQIYVDYEIDTWMEKTEAINIQQGQIIVKTESQMPMESLKSNSFSVTHEITGIIAISGSMSYQVQGYTGNTIYLLSPAMSDDILLIHYTYAFPYKFFIEPIGPDFRNDLAWPIQAGDAIGICSQEYEIGQGDIVVSLTQINRVSEIMTRGSGRIDQLPYYDIDSISGDIYSDDKTVFVKGIDFDLYDYNKIIWKTPGPSAGSKYSLSVNERIAYRVYNQNPEINSNENKRLPKRLHLRKLEKYQTGEPYTGVAKEQSNTDWLKKFGG